MNCIFFTCSFDFKNDIFFKSWVMASLHLDKRLPVCKFITNLIWLVVTIGYLGFPVASLVKNPPANAVDRGDMGLICGSRRSLGRGHGNPLQYSCLENSMAREAWWAAVYGAAKSWTRLSINDHRVLSKNFSTVPSFLGFNLYQSLYTWTLKSETVSWGLLQNQWFSGWLYRCLQSRSGTHSKFIHSTASTVHLLFVRCWGYNTE